MARARYQVLVIPYCITDGQVRFCAFRRKDLDIWQFIAGGGEDEDASIIESARREAFEYAFAVKVENTSLQLSREHTEYEWAAYARAYAMLQYDSNRTALWELNRRLELGVLN